MQRRFSEEEHRLFITEQWPLNATDYMSENQYEIQNTNKMLTCDEATVKRHSKCFFSPTKKS